jgi:hypothetical protein
MVSFKSLGLLVSTAVSLELSPTNWEMETVSGTKDVFLCFCEAKNAKCDDIKNEWASFMKEWRGHKKVVVASVNCKGDGMPICSMAEITGVPTILYGNPKGKDVDKLTKYEGDLTFQGFHKLAVATYGVPKICNPGRGYKYCSSDSKAIIDFLKQKTPEELKAHLIETRGKIERIESTFSVMIDKVNTKMEKLQDEYKLIREDEAKEKELQQKMDSLQTQLTQSLKIKDDSLKKIDEQNGLTFTEMMLSSDVDDDYDPDLDPDIEQPEEDEDYDPDFDDDNDEF